MTDCELNIATIIGPYSESVLGEIKTNITHENDDFGIYFAISNKYYYAKIHFYIVNSYSMSDIPSNAQAIIITSKEDDAKKIISNFKSISNPMKFLWIIDPPTNSEAVDELEDLCFECGFELILSKKNSTHNTQDKRLDCANITNNKINTFQVPLLFNGTIDNPSLKLFRSLECHKWTNSIKQAKDDISLDRAIEVVKEAREWNLKSNDISERVARATSAIMEIKSLL
ncbi:hypothetical protein BMR1_01G02430 [Babesia microti strain RI]|uniref:Uncharacterized protein n=1 Tax=Babesia microti (strain RI) TaxID=1133968 RepID=I7J8N0_BABMR|nr:hypothetical protein BMR1_01G02430 [Babesia microti strain RI]CCF72944.1 hypothetical protein BMR1_01G02430 [Babesia microti strain RI]|eukprot:XP_012647553.1 hypothetical protein BMR1_01G02430 [Babesia microti strain RI]